MLFGGVLSVASGRGSSAVASTHVPTYELIEHPMRKPEVCIADGTDAGSPDPLICLLR